MWLAGDLDLVVGEYYGTLIYYENTGTSTAPVFVARTLSANPFDGIYVGGCSESALEDLVGGCSAPALGDLDGDGTLRQCPLIDTLRLHNVWLAQATWTSWWPMDTLTRSMVLATGAAGGGATNADESARQVRTLIATRAIIVARIHAFSGLKNR